MIGQNPSTLNRPGWISAHSRPPGNQVMLVVAPHAANPLMLELAARLAVEQPLRVLDGGNRFNVYPVAKAVRRCTARLEEALGRIILSRAFTCYQLQALLDMLQAATDQCWVLEPVPEVKQQMELF
jgi:hypothetical protein